MMTKLCSFLFCLTLALGLAAPALAWDLADTDEPGSVLVFPAVFTGSVLTVDQGLVPRTRFEISVTCPKGADCSNITTVNLRAHWVCGGDANSVCAEVDFNLSTTINGTITFNTENLDPKTNTVPPPPNCPDKPGEEERGGGYLIVWAIDDPKTGNAIKFDGLIGDEVIAGSSLSARAHNAIPIQAAEWLCNLAPTDGNGDGRLDFDGNEYKAVTGKIYGSVKYGQSTPDVETSLILLTLDVKSNQPNAATSVGLDFFNEREDLMSTGANFTCWGEFHLFDLPGGDHLNSTDFGYKGLVTSGAAVQNGNPATMIGVVESEEEFGLPVNAIVSGTFASNLPRAGGSITPPCSPSTPGSCGVTCTVAPTPFRVCVPLPPPLTPVCQIVTIPGGISCSITTNVTSTVDVTREYSYPLFNDSVPVPTVFEPAPLPQPPPD